MRRISLSRLTGSIGAKLGASFGVVVILLLGLCGVLVPGVPGSWLVWAAVLWWALKDPQPVAWSVLVGATVALFLSQVVRWSLPPRRLRESGATPRMAVYAGAGAFPRYRSA